MSYMFRGASFNGNISRWDVSQVYGMEGMFDHSKFNGDISQWDVSNVKDMSYMFKGTPLEGEGKEPDWYKRRRK